MIFKVLGPLGIVVNENTTTLHGARQRTLLALLLLDPGGVVTKEQAFEELWGCNVTARSDNALQAVIARLRRILSDRLGDRFAKERLVTKPAGYALGVDRRMVDIHVFDQLLTQARGRMSTEPAAARNLFDKALELWDGPPLQGVGGGPICQSAIVQFEEMRLAAFEDRVRVSIALDGCASAVSELKKLVFLYPTRERLSELLMVCLYRMGRQAEAVAAYKHVHSRLVKEFGMEPSPSLKRCMMSILNHDPDLGGVERVIVPQRHNGMLTAS
jgi:DNA-binding SARP family transcriptional activator